jgi:hypothetical protein
MGFWPVKAEKTLKRGSGEKCSLSCNSFNHTDIGSWFIETILSLANARLEYPGFSADGKNSSFLTRRENPGYALIPLRHFYPFPQRSFPLPDFRKFFLCFSQVVVRQLFIKKIQDFGCPRGVNCTFMGCLFEKREIKVV